MVSRSVLKPDKGKNADFWLKQTWRLDIVHYIRIWSSRTGNVLHSSRESAFVCLLFNKVEEVQHSIVIPSDSHSGINYPPFANANGFETTDCLECLQILDILIYGRRVCFKAGDWTLCTILGYGLPERERGLHSSRLWPLAFFWPCGVWRFWNYIRLQDIFCIFNCQWSE